MSSPLEPTLRRALTSFVLLVAVAAVAGACSSSSVSTVGTSAGALSPSSGWSGCSGTFDTHESPTGAYFITDFGCSSSPSFTDSSDNCCPAGVVQAASAGICHAGVTTAGCTSNVGTSASIACERAVNWFSTGGSTYGLGTRLRLTRPDTGKSVVVFVIDDGPACYREQQFGGYALDISYPAIIALYGEEEGASDRAVVQVAVVASSTPLGVVGASGTTTGPDASTSTSTHDAAVADARDAVVVDAHTTTEIDAPAAVPEAAVDAAVLGPACTTDGECNPGSDGSGQYCSEGHCVAGCDADWECPGDTSCVSGTCQ